MTLAPGKILKPRNHKGIVSWCVNQQRKLRIGVEGREWLIEGSAEGKE